MSLKTKIIKFGAKTVIKLRKHSPTILFVGGLITGGAAIVQFCKASTKVPALMEKHTQELEKIEDAKEHPENYTDENGNEIVMTDKLYKAHKGKAMRSAVCDFLKLYGKALAIALLSTVMLCGGFKILHGRWLETTAIASSALAANDKLRNNIVAKYGEEEYRNLRYSDISQITKAGDAPETQSESDQDLPVDPWRSYKEAAKRNAKNSDFSILWTEESAPQRHWMRNPMMCLMHLQSLQKQANMVLDMKGFLTYNELCGILDTHDHKSQTGHFACWIKGKDYVNFGLDDIFNEVRAYANASYHPDDHAKIYNHFKDGWLLDIIPPSNLMIDNDVNDICWEEA